MKVQSFLGLSSATILLFIFMAACDKVDIPGSGTAGLPMAGQLFSNVPISVPPSTVEKLGNVIYDWEVGRWPKETDTQVTRNVAKIFGRLKAAALAHPTYGVVARETDWKLNTLREPKLATAAAFPGGGIALYEGLFKKVQTKGELAFILGHEMTHLLARHHLQRINRDTAAAMTTVGSALASGTTPDKMDPEVIGPVAGAMGIGYLFGVRQPLQREKELEADCLGLELAAKAGYDPSTTEELLLDQAKRQGADNTFQLLNDHPTYKERHTHISNACLSDAQTAFNQVEDGERQKASASLLDDDVEASKR